MTCKLNISLGALKYLASELDNELDGVNICQLRICRQDNVISVYNQQGLVSEYDVQRIEERMPIQVLLSSKRSDMSAPLETT